MALQLRVGTEPEDLLANQPRQTGVSEEHEVVGNARHESRGTVSRDAGCVLEPSDQNEGRAGRTKHHRHPRRDAAARARRGETAQEANGISAGDELDRNEVDERVTHAGHDDYQKGHDTRFSSA